MPEADGALRGLLTLAVVVLALAFPFVASGYHIYQGSQVLILAIALLGLNLLTGFNGQISLGHGAFFRHRRLRRGDPDNEVWPAVLGGHTGRELGVLHCRLSVRFSRAQVRRPLSRARHFRPRGRDPPDSELH